MKRGQMSIFVIVGLLVVGGIALFFMIKDIPIINIGGTQEENPDSFLHVCIEDKIREGINLISIQGGSINNKLNKTFNLSEDKYVDISYLCYNQNNYLPCINQNPMLIQHLKKELKEYISPEMENCFNNMKTSLEKEGYNVDITYRGFDIELFPGKLSVNTNSELTLSKTDETSKKENFKVVLKTKFYDIGKVVQEIIGQEAEFCNFEHRGYMIFYPEFKISKFNTGDLDTIYTVKHRETQEKFIFAIRGCITPPGM